MFSSRSALPPESKYFPIRLEIACYVAPVWVLSPIDKGLPFRLNPGSKEGVVVGVTVEEKEEKKKKEGRNRAAVAVAVVRGR